MTGKLLVIIFIVQSILCASHHFAQGQNEKLDSMQYVLETSKSENTKVKTLIKISEHYERTDLLMSLQYAEQAMNLAKKTKTDSLISFAAMNLGNIQFYLGLLEIAAKNFSLYLELEQKAGNPLAVANACTNLAAIHIQMKNMEKGKKELLKAKEIFEAYYKTRSDTTPVFQLVTVYNNLGIIYQNQKKYPQAIDYYHRGISLAQRIPSQISILANLYNNLGITLLEQRKMPEAYNAFEQALAIRIDQNDSKGIASSYRSIANFHYKNNNYSQSLYYLNKGYKIAREVSDVSIISSYSSQLYQTYKTINKPDSALKYLEITRELEENINRENTLKELTRIELTSQFREKEKVEHEKRLRRELIILIFGVILLFALTVSVLLLFVYRGRFKRFELEKTNTDLKSKNLLLEKERLEKELEVKNKELTTNVIYQIKKNELLNEIAQNLIKHSSKFSKENQSLINSIISDLEKSKQDNTWEEFEIRFHQVHNEFYDKLNSLHPDLSLNERRLCAFLKLDMSTKEISSITGQSPRSIDVARTRLRKKLELTNSDSSLTDYLMSI